MISLNKLRKAVINTLANESDYPPEIFVFVDRGDYALVAARTFYKIGDVARSVVGTYWRKTDKFFVVRDQLSGYQALSYIADAMKKIITGHEATELSDSELISFCAKMINDQRSD